MHCQYGRSRPVSAKLTRKTTIKESATTVQVRAYGGCGRGAAGESLCCCCFAAAGDVAEGGDEDTARASGCAESGTGMVTGEAGRGNERMPGKPLLSEDCERGRPDERRACCDCCELPAGGEATDGVGDGDGERASEVEAEEGDAKGSGDGEESAAGEAAEEVTRMVSG